MLPHLTTVSKHLDAMGWGNYANDHEDANGQYEQNWQYADALTTADRLILFRLMVHTLAQRDGRYATFMPKPFADKTGNRTQMIRVPEPDRIEMRLCDGAANPYLMFAAILACGLDGIDRGLDPGEPNMDNLFELPAEEVAAKGIAALPPTLLHAADCLVSNDVLAEGLGMTGEGPYRDYYAKVKRDEFLAHHHQVTRAEVNHYLTLF